MTDLKEISELIQKGRAPQTQELVTQALNDGIPANEILEKGLLDGMNVIGEKFKNNEVFVPEVLIAARAMNKGIDVLKPLLAAEGVQQRGTAILGTVKGDLHDIGKSLVKIMLEGKGITVIDIGVDVPAEKFVQAATDNNAQLICCSALLTTTMTEMKNVVDAVAAAGLKGKVKVMVGGAPVSQSFADSIGADCYTSDAASAADAAVELLK